MGKRQPELGGSRQLPLSGGKQKRPKKGAQRGCTQGRGLPGVGVRGASRTRTGTPQPAWGAGTGQMPGQQSITAEHPALPAAQIQPPPSPSSSSSSRASSSPSPLCHSSQLTPLLRSPSAAGSSNPGHQHPADRSARSRRPLTGVLMTPPAAAGADPHLRQLPARLSPPFLLRKHLHPTWPGRAAGMSEHIHRRRAQRGSAWGLLSGPR